MNRRRGPASGGKKTGRKRPARRKPIRKTPARKSFGRKSPRRTGSPKPNKSTSKSPASKTAGSDRNQNRRKPTPKKPRQTRPVRTWREKAAGARERLDAWVEHRRGLVRRVGQVALFGFAAAAMLWLGEQTARYARTADAFAVRDVVVEGNRRLGEIDVRRAARLQIGSNIFEVSPEGARNHLLQHPWIKNAEVVRKLPGLMRVKVEERTPVALVALDQLYLVSEEGALFKRLGVDDPVDFPVITGIASERFYDDFNYRTAVLLRSMAVLQDYEGAGLAAREPVSEIHFEGPTDIELFVGEDGMHVRLGTGQHRQKLRRLRQVLARLVREKARPAYVYLDNVRSPERVTVRVH